MTVSLVDVLFIEPPPLTEFGNYRTYGSFGRFKAKICYPPLDMIVPAGYLIQEGYTCGVLDANSKRLSMRQVAEAIEYYAPKVVVINTSTTTIYKDMEVAVIAKRNRGKPITIAVNTHVMKMPEETLRLCSDLDAVCYVEQEETILNFLRSGMDLENTTGLVINKNGVPKVNPPTPPPASLDQFGIPAHHLLDLNLYEDPACRTKPMVVTYCAMGCINSCIYCPCPIFGKVKFRSVSILEKELVILKKLGVQEVKFHDSSLADHPESQALFTMLADFPFFYAATLRASSVDQVIADLLKKAKFRVVFIGCETGDPEIMKRIRKNVTLDQVENSVRLFKDRGIITAVHFQVGLPGENLETTRKTLAFAKKLRPDMVSFAISTPHPGTPFWDYIVNNGYFLNNITYDRYDPSLPPVFDYPGFTSKQMYRRMKQMYRSYYFDWRYLLSQMMKVRSYRDLSIRLVNCIGLIRRFKLFPFVPRLFGKQ